MADIFWENAKISEKLTTKHPKEKHPKHPLNLEENLEEVLLSQEQKQAPNKKF